MKNLEVEHSVRYGNPSLRKECNKLQKQVEQKLEQLEKLDLNDKTVKQLTEQFMYLENKMINRSNDVKLLSHHLQKMEEQKNAQIAELERSLEHAKARPRTERASPQGNTDFLRFDIDVLIMLQYNYSNRGM